MRTLPALICAASIPLAACGAAFAADPATTSPSDVASDNGVTHHAVSAHDEVSRAAATIRTMTQQDPGIRDQLRDAKAVFVMPRYGRGALIVGGAGGPAVAMVRHDQQWTGPALYHVGSVSIGAQAGGEGGSVVMILKSDRAVAKLEQANNFSLDANAGLSIVTWSRDAETQTSSPDIVMWSDMKGLYAGASVAVSDAKFDGAATSTLYGRDVSARDILQGTVHTALADDLVKALPAA